MSLPISPRTWWFSRMPATATAGIILLLSAVLAPGVGAVRPALDEEGEVETQRLRPEQGEKFIFMAQASFSGSFFKKEGELDSAGERQTETRIEVLQRQRPDLLTVLQGVARVWVAPTRSSMAQAMVAVCKAWSFDESGEVHHPQWEVLPALRPKEPFTLRASVEDVETYLATLATKLGKSYFPGPDSEGSRTALSEAATQLAKSYGTFLSQGHLKSKGPQNAVELFENIHTVKQALYDFSQKVLIVADVAFGNFMFMPGLPRMDYGETDPQIAILRMLRENVMGFAEAGLMGAEWTVSPYTDNQQHLLANPRTRAVTVPYLKHAVIDASMFTAEGLPNLNVKKGLTLPFDAQGYVEEEVSVRGLLPSTAQWSVFFLKKKKVKESATAISKWRERLFGVVFNPSGSVPTGYITWSTPFGDRVKGRADINVVTLMHDSVDGMLRLKTPIAEWILDAPSTEVETRFKNAVQEVRAKLDR
mmetsp:Transcript_68279/g.163852  ORF Transcript_68279/g.163852 Transcript_68279/m.163852 type:complete len:477 (+) Transcript_68279:92-1522(+)